MRSKGQQFQLERPPQTLRFSPTAWAKLLFWRDYGDTEVGGFGISRHDDLLLIEDVQLVKQSCGWTHVVFDDDSVADFFDRQVDAGRRPEQFARIWVHTHPGDCPLPSQTDEETFDRVFGNTDWAIMFILACGGESFARLRFNVGPTGTLEIPVQIDFQRTFPGCAPKAWREEYRKHVQPRETLMAAADRVADMEFLDDWEASPRNSRLNLPSDEGDEF